MTKTLSAALAALLLSAAPSLADIMVKDPYARAASPTAMSGAAFMMLMNHGEEDDTLVSAASEVAGRVELHTHTEDENGVMRMVEIEGGIPVPAGGMAMLERGGMHVMLMGLTAPLEQDAEIEVTLTFEKAGDKVLTIPVDYERKVDHGGHGGHDHSNMNHSNDS